MKEIESKLPLGKATAYKAEYDPALLCPFPRQFKRDEIGLESQLPFSGQDIWNAYELSWLTPKGKPVVAMGEFRFPCESPNLIESKSFKLYLNSFNQTCCENFASVENLLKEDLGRAAGAPVEVRLFDAEHFSSLQIGRLPGRCIDDQDVEISSYKLNPDLLEGSIDEGRVVEETLHSHLLKSNCLVTSQPDWGSLLVRYRGPKIDEAALLRYLISFRQHNEFHEQCVERIFVDLQRYCQPEQLTVYARYTRRGGLDINPFRSNFESDVENVRLARQ
ncbi:MAG: NADPH-dependent 7-cyano-7-deazaguanine reductase QueF [Desulfuromonadales bacterium]|nr:NADPH-dependent 7-cyano-7-deazaguanine reductase QueF [Desulfuromonadales bacterium]